MHNFKELVVCLHGGVTSEIGMTSIVCPNGHSCVYSGAFDPHYEGILFKWRFHVL